jgi:hypothetical protein
LEISNPRFYMKKLVPRAGLEPARPLATTPSR